MKDYNMIMAASTLMNGRNGAIANVKDRTDAEIVATEEYKAARDAADCDEIAYNMIKANITAQNPNIDTKLLEKVAAKMGYPKPETVTETIERLRKEFRAIDEKEAVARYADEFSEACKLAESMAYEEEHKLPEPARRQYYYTGREQYEDHRQITRNNIEAKRGASCAERFDANMNAFSEHLEIFARRFKR